MPLYNPYNKFAAELMLAAITFLLLPVAVVVRGYVIMKVWGWHILPSFSSLPTLGMAGAIGLSFMVSVLTMRISRNKGDDDNPAVYLLVSMFIGLFSNFVLLCWGWLLYVVLY